MAAEVLSLRTTSGTPPRVQRGILQSLLQGQEGLAGGDLGVAPSRVAEYQLEQQVGVGLSGDGHLEFPAVGEVELGFATRRMHLGEVHLLIRTMQRPPILQSSLQRAQLGRACCLIQKCYRNFSTWGPSRPALIPALQRVPPWAHQPWRRPAFWP